MKPKLWSLSQSFRVLCGGIHIHSESINHFNCFPGLDTASGGLAKTRWMCTHPSNPDSTQSSHRKQTNKKKKNMQRTQTRQCKSGIKRVNNVHMVSAPEGTIPFSSCCCESRQRRGDDVTNEPCKIRRWIMKHNTAFCNRKNKRWDHQQAREARVKESKQWLNDQKLAERVYVSLQGTLIYPQVKVRFQAQCNYSWGCQFDINAASRNSLIGLRGESEPENILTF